MFLLSRGRTIRKCNLLHTFSGLWSVKGEEPPLEESDLKILGSCKTRKTTYPWCSAWEGDETQGRNWNIWSWEGKKPLTKEFDLRNWTLEDQHTTDLASRSYDLWGGWSKETVFLYDQKQKTCDVPPEKGKNHREESGSTDPVKAKIPITKVTDLRNWTLVWPENYRPKLPDPIIRRETDLKKLCSCMTRKQQTCDARPERGRITGLHRIIWTWDG